MSKVQTRRGISVNGGLHARFQAWCRENGVSMSAIVEELLVDLAGGPMPSERPSPPRERGSYPRSTDEARLEKLRSWRVDVPPSPPSPPVPVGQGDAPLSAIVRIDWPLAVVELVVDKLAGDTEIQAREGRPSWKLDPAAMSAALDSAIVRMLDSYDAIASGADHCAVCRSKLKPFVPMLAGESVVAVCSVCVRERRALDGRRSA